ncbi:uncharacterized protein LOC112183786 [Rosa chinensis]|uniref:uncharacterized protein LOC112183786 n=1 Tax=Rosa chinensis TaxID=74649 RepID=UPI001AD8DB25|nr:uncharacterized protein LOC112183786 [Rosa chinensis]
MNDAIHGFIRQGNCELLASNIVQGNIYEISRFFTSYSQPSYKIVPHPAQIHFTGKTIIKHIPELPASIPLHCFYLIDYSLLASRSKNEILSDIFGRIKMIQPPKEKLTSDNRITLRCDIYMQNIRKEDVQVTLWGDVARTVNVDAIRTTPPPALAVFTSLKVTKYPNKIAYQTQGTPSFS